MNCTLVILKPDAVHRNLIGTILSRIEALDCKIAGLFFRQLYKYEVEWLYQKYMYEDFFNDLLQFMTSGWSLIVAVSGEDVQVKIRELTLQVRQELAEDHRRNVMHSSDSTATALEEINFFFNDWQLQKD